MDGKSSDSGPVDAQGATLRPNLDDRDLLRNRIDTGPAMPGQNPYVDPLLGQTVDRYEVLRRVGDGAMGVVYEVKHKGLGKRLALKVIHGELAQVPEFTARFAQEARACSSLSHENCIQVYDFGRAKSGKLFLAMEFVDGRPLNELLQKEPLDVSKSLEITRQVLSGLAHAHDVGIVHRDIKLDNVMLTEGEDGSQTAKILDFGIAKVPMQSGGQLTQAGVIFGTPEYMAPEQVMTTQVDERADLYSVGVLLWCMITGHPPIDGDGAVELLNSKLTTPAPRLAEAYPDRFPLSLSSFLAKALEREPSSRFSSAQEMLDALDVLDLVPGRRLSREVRRPGWRAVKKRLASPFVALRRGLRWANSHLQAWYHCDDDLLHLPSWPLRLRLLRTTRRGKGIVLSFAAIVAASVALLLVGVRQPEQVAGWGGPITPSLEKRLIQIRLFLGKGACREASLDVQNLLRDKPRLPVAHYLHGASEFCRGNHEVALASYRVAIKHQPRYGSDARIREDVTSILGSGKASVKAKLAAIPFANDHLGPGGLKLLLKMASSEPDPTARHAAVALVKERGIGPNIDWAASLTLDLRQLETCRERKQVVARLRKLGDASVLPALKEARDLRVNACARRAIQRAIKELQQKK